MTVDDLVAITGGTVSPGGSVDLETSIAGVTEDSRKIVSGSVFVAISGETVDGHDFVEEASARGACVIITDSPEKIPESVSTVVVPHARRALGIIAHALVDDPSGKMTVIGVTGTNGKSSTVTMICHLLEYTGHKTASFGTLGYTIGGKTREAAHTTPFNEDLAALFAEARDAGDTHVVMEVSSHALEQERVSGIAFDVGLFTNLTQDHLDYHKTMDEYIEAKLKLFSEIESDSGITIANADDPVSERFREASRVSHYAFGKNGDVSVSDVEFKGNRNRFTIASPWGTGAFDMALPGKHNVSNVVGAVTVCGALGVEIGLLQEGVSSMPSVPGRFEVIDCGQPFQVVVDYAHTEDGLLNVLTAAREVCSGRIIAIFGCGGDRDKTKRPKMAAVVARLADFGIVTSDNPRSESPERILMDIEVGMPHAGRKSDEDYLVIEDRTEAIHRGLAMAGSGDLVLIAGKGHEDYQILNSGTIHFDDREVARECLRGRG